MEFDYNDITDENMDRLPVKTNFITTYLDAVKQFFKTFQVSARFKNKATKQYETKHTNKYMFNIRKLLREPIKVLDLDHNHITSYIEECRYKVVKIAEKQGYDQQKHIVSWDDDTPASELDDICNLMFMQKMLFYLENTRVYHFLNITRDAVLDLLKEESPDITESSDWENLQKTHIAIKNFPVELEISQIKSDMTARACSIKGQLVSYDNAVRVEILKTEWLCANCNVTVKVKGGKMPIKCTNCKENRPGFQEIPDLAETIDFIYIKVQQQFNTDQAQTNITDIPIKIQGKHLIDYFNSKMEPAANLRVTGVVELGSDAHIRGQENERHIIVNCVGIDVEGDSSVIEYSDRLLDVVRRVDQNAIDQHYEKLVRSIAPHLYKQEMIKTGVLMMYVGSDPIIRGSGTRIRGDIVVMLVGDPAHGKSDYGIYTLKVLPQSIRTIGGSSTTSKVGLTTAIEIVNDVKRMVLGVLPLCDLRGAAVIDELDKRNKDEFEVLSIPLDDNQKIPTHKSSFHVDVNARCPVLLIGNPSKNGGKWDSSKSIYEQTNFAAWLMSRADIVFVLYDDGDMERHAATLEHIEKMDSSSVFESDYESNKKNKLYTELNIDKIEQDIVSNTFNDFYDAEYMRHEIHYLKTNFKPVLKPNTPAYDKLKKEWLKLKQINIVDSYEDGTVVTNPLMDARKFNSLRRLACASARLHRRNIVTEEDVQLAVDLMLYSFAGLVPKAHKENLSKNPLDQLSSLLSDKNMSRLEKTFVSKMVKDKEAYVKNWIMRLTRFNQFIARRGFEKCQTCKGSGTIIRSFGPVQEPQKCMSCTHGGYYLRSFRYNDLEADIVNAKVMTHYECDQLFRQYINVKLVEGTSGNYYKPLYRMDSIEVKTIVEKMAEGFGDRWFDSEMKRRHGISGESGFDTADKMK